VASPVSQLFWAALATCAWVAGLFFLRFWRDSRDRLFLFFCFAFWVLALHWLGLFVVRPGEESRHYLYVLRLVAFVLIAVGIVDKNRRGRFP
jgi:hypothetical protein